MFNVFAISVSSQSDDQRVFSMNKYSKRQKKLNGQPIMSHRDTRCFSNILFGKHCLTVLKFLL